MCNLLNRTCLGLYYSLIDLFKNETIVGVPYYMNFRCASSLFDVKITVRSSLASGYAVETACRMNDKPAALMLFDCVAGAGKGVQWQRRTGAVHVFTLKRKK